MVQTAYSWIGTPYVHRASVKAVGIDCATFLVEVFRETGLVSFVDLPKYSPQWHLHRDEERYTDFIRQFAPEVSRPPMPGDVVVFRFHRCFAHGAIVVEWPKIIHAMRGQGCVVDDAERNQMLSTVSERTRYHGEPRARKTFSYWG